jgi:hypothetical protein
MKDVNFERQLKDAFDSIFETPNLQRLKEAAELVARGTMGFGVGFRFGRFGFSFGFVLVLVLVLVLVSVVLVLALVLAPFRDS